MLLPVDYIFGRVYGPMKNLHFRYVFCPLFFFHQQCNWSKANVFWTASVTPNYKISKNNLKKTFSFSHNFETLRQRKPPVLRRGHFYRWGGGNRGRGHKFGWKQIDRDASQISLTTFRRGDFNVQTLGSHSHTIHPHRNLRWAIGDIFIRINSTKGQKYNRT